MYVDDDDVCAVWLILNSLVYRHFGAPYQDMHADYTGQGVDQLRECINKIKTNPSDR